MAFAGVVDGEFVAAEDAEEVLEAGDNGSHGVDVVALVDEVAFGCTDWMGLRNISRDGRYVKGIRVVMS